MAATGALPPCDRAADRQMCKRFPENEQCNESGAKAEHLERGVFGAALARAHRHGVGHNAMMIRITTYDTTRIAAMISFDMATKPSWNACSSR